MYRPAVFLLSAFLVALASVTASAQDTWNSQPSQGNQPGWGNQSDQNNLADRPASQQTILENTPEEEPKILVILDPGHGGTDLGARTSKGILEKSVTLRLAKIIRSSLSTVSGIEIRLTRKADRAVPALDRVQLANSSRGKLYVSLHTDGGMGPRWHPLKIFMCANNSKKSDDGDWSALNRKFAKQTRRLATIIARNLRAVQKKRGVEIVKSSRVGHLCGLAMPAVMVEPVDMSNPDDELSVEKDEYIGKLGSAIARAIESYLVEQGLKVRQTANQGY